MSSDNHLLFTWSRLLRRKMTCNIACFCVCCCQVCMFLILCPFQCYHIPGRVVTHWIALRCKVTPSDGSAAPYLSLYMGGKTLETYIFRLPMESATTATTATQTTASQVFKFTLGLLVTIIFISFCSLSILFS